MEIKINFPFEVCLELRQRLETLYGLRQAAVVPAAWTDEDLENALGEVGAEMLSRFMADAASVGVGWGVTVSAVVRHYPAQPVAGSLVVGLLGGQPQLSGVNPGEIAKGLSRKLGGECYTVPAPCFVNSKETRTILLGQPSIRQTLELAERVDLALVGVGTTMHNATLVKAGFLSPSEMAQLRAMGAVGDILGHFFDDQGRIIESEFEDRVISLELGACAASRRCFAWPAGRRRYGRSMRLRPAPSMLWSPTSTSPVSSWLSRRSGRGPGEQMII